MKEVTQVLATQLDRIKAANPLAFVVLVLAMIALIILIDTHPYFSGGLKNFWLSVKYLFIAITGFTGPRTFKHLPESHPKKKAVLNSKIQPDEH